MSAIREVMRELEEYKELAAEGEKARTELKELKEVLKDYERCRFELVSFLGLGTVACVVLFACIALRTVKNRARMPQRCLYYTSLSFATTHH